MKPFMPQECSFKLFTSDGAVVQRKMLLGSKYKLLPHITAVLGGSSEADYKVLSTPKLCAGGHRDSVQSPTEQCDACLLRLQDMLMWAKTNINLRVLQVTGSETFCPELNTL